MLTIIDKVETFRVSYDKVTLVKRRRSEAGARNREQKLFRKGWIRFIQTLIKR